MCIKLKRSLTRVVTHGSDPLSPWQIVGWSGTTFARLLFRHSDKHPPRDHITPPFSLPLIPWVMGAQPHLKIPKETLESIIVHSRALPFGLIRRTLPQ